MRSVLQSYHRGPHRHRAYKRTRTSRAEVAEDHVIAVRTREGLGALHRATLTVGLGDGQVETLRELQLGPVVLLDREAKAVIARPRLREVRARGGPALRGEDPRDLAVGVRHIRLELLRGGVELLDRGDTEAAHLDHDDRVADDGEIHVQTDLSGAHGHGLGWHHELDEVAEHVEGRHRDEQVDDRSRRVARGEGVEVRAARARHLVGRKREVDEHLWTIQRTEALAHLLVDGVEHDRGVRHRARRERRERHLESRSRVDLRPKTKTRPGHARSASASVAPLGPPRGVRE